jgi:hypothetical protein
MRSAEFGGGALLVSQRRACAWQAGATCRRGGPSYGGPRTFVQVLQVQHHGRAGLSVRWRPAHRSARASSAVRACARCAAHRNARLFVTARAWRFAPALRGTQRLRCICSFATAGIGHAAHAGGCFGRARRVRTATERRGVANAVLFAQAWRAMTANPSIERTSKRLRLFAAAHVERYAAENPTFAHARLDGAPSGLRRGASRFGVAW